MNLRPYAARLLLRTWYSLLRFLYTVQIAYAAKTMENVRAYRAARGIMSEDIMREMGDAIETEEQQEASFEEHI